MTYTRTDCSGAYLIKYVFDMYTLSTTLMCTHAENLTCIHIDWSWAYTNEYITYIGHVYIEYKFDM